MNKLSHWISILLTVLLLLCGVGVTLADHPWPTPPEGWWKDLRGGETATYELTMDSSAMKMVITIDKIERSLITFNTQTFMGGQSMPKHIQTIDARDPLAVGGNLPPGATVEKGEETSIQVGHKTFNCTIYRVEFEGLKMKVWHSSQLPRIFSGGNVKAESGSQGMNSTVTLKAYNGNLLQN